MDTEDRDHFRTIALALPAHSEKLEKMSNREMSHSRLDPAYCLQKAEMIAGCYRRDEAQNPEMFAAALALILGEYPYAVVDYVADPRTGVITEFPMGLPNVGQIRQFCDVVYDRQERLAAPKRVAMPYVPPPTKPGQIDATQFAELVSKGMSLRPTGAFEPGGYLGPRS